MTQRPSAAGGAGVASSEPLPVDADIASPDVYEHGDPHEAFARLRARDPVHWQPFEQAPRGGFWAVTKHSDVVAVGKDWATYSSASGINLEHFDEDALLHRSSLIETDPPAHARLRRIVSAVFTPRAVESYADYARSLARSLVAKCASEGEIDWVTDVAAPMPIRVIMHILGIPEGDAPMLIALSNQIVGAGDPEYAATADEHGDLDLQLLPLRSPASHELFEYGRWIGERRRQEPTGDVVSRLVHAEVGGDRLTDLEYVNFFLLFVVAGNETTRTSLSRGMLAFADNPSQLARLGADAALMPAAVEEILRWATPIYYFRRTATRDVQLRGTSIQAGDWVVMWYISANFDDEAFAEPYSFDVARDPNDHVSFGGGGPHFCLGAFLARLQLRIFFEEFLAAGLQVELTGPVRRIRSNLIHGLKAMPVRVSAR